MAAKFKPCSVAECNGNAHYSARGNRGWCSTHYQRSRKHGDLNKGRFSYKSCEETCSVDGCCKPRVKRNYCGMHYQRWRKNGSPTAGRAPNGSLHQWILDNLDYSDDQCLIWPFGTTPDGYGVIGHNGKSRGVHNLICELAHGAPPSPQHEAAHSCGNGHLACVNQTHLRWATPKENCSDKEIHQTKLFGEHVPGSKLTTKNVLKIRAMLDTGLYLQSEIAEIFGVTKGCVSKIKLRTTWGWL